MVRWGVVVGGAVGAGGRGGPKWARAAAEKDVPSSNESVSGCASHWSSRKRFLAAIAGVMGAGRNRKSDTEGSKELPSMLTFPREVRFLGESRGDKARLRAMRSEFSFSAAISLCAAVSAAVSGVCGKKSLSGAFATSVTVL